MPDDLRQGPRPAALDTLGIAHVLGLEALAIRVTAALQAQGIDVLLLKGPVTNRWLYGDALARRFGDIDLLVAPAAEQAARAVLQQLGFRNDHDRVLGIHRPDYESSWTLPTGSIDLHIRIAGVPADRMVEAWARLTRDSVQFSLHGQPVDTLSTVARTMLIGLHAARSRYDSGALRDLEVGLAELPRPLWRDAAGLASELGAGACFVLGLRRLESGRVLLAELDYSAPPTVESLLLEHGAPQAAFVLAASLLAGDRLSSKAVHHWFRTEGDGHPPLRAIAAAVSRFPRALLLVLRLRRRVRRHELSAAATA